MKVAQCAGLHPRRSGRGDRWDVRFHAGKEHLREPQMRNSDWSILRSPNGDGREYAAMVIGIFVRDRRAGDLVSKI